MHTRDKKLVVVDPNYSDKYFKSIAEFRQNKRFTDVVLRIDGEELVAHKAILAAASPFFNAMFDESFAEGQKDAVDLHHETNAVIMTAILDYMYSGKLSIAIKDIALLLLNFDYFQMDGVREECERVLLEHVNHENCVDLLMLAEEISLHELCKKSSTHLIDNFNEIYNVDDLKELTLIQLEAILKAVSSRFPDATYKSIISWLKHDEANRSKHTHNLLTKYVKMSRLSEQLTTHKMPKYIQGDIFMMSDSGAKKWLLESLGFKQLCLYILLTDGAGENIFYEFDVGNKSLAQLTKWPTTVEEFSVAKYRNSIYIVGGEIDGNLTSTGLAYDIDNKAWSNFDCPVMKKRCGLCVGNDKIYMAGGWTDIGSKATYNYDFEAGFLKNLPDMEFARWSPGVAYYNSSIYVFGGCEPIVIDDDEVSVVERYDPREGIWSHAGSLSTDSIACTSATASDLIYSMDRQNGRLYSFDPRSLMSNVLKEFSGPGTLTSADDHLYVGHERGISEYLIDDEVWNDVFTNSFYMPIIVA